LPLLLLKFLLCFFFSYYFLDSASFCYFIILFRFWILFFCLPLFPRLLLLLLLLILFWIGKHKHTFFVLFCFSFAQRLAFCLPFMFTFGFLGCTKIFHFLVMRFFELSMRRRWRRRRCWLRCSWLSSLLLLLF